MATNCRTCVKYDIIEDHALGRKGSIARYYLFYFMWLYNADRPALMVSG